MPVLILVLAMFIALIIPTTRATLIGWLKIVAIITWGSAKPALRRVGILPPLGGGALPPPIWPQIQAVAQGAGMAILAGLFLFILAVLAFVGSFYFHNQLGIQVGLAIVFVSLWLVMLISLAFKNPVAGATHPELGSGMAMLVQLVCFVAIANLGMPNFATSSTFGYILLGTMYFGAVCWVWGAMLGWRGKLGGHAMFTANIILSLWLVLSFAFPQDVKLWQAKKNLRDVQISRDATATEVLASKTVGTITKRTRVFKLQVNDDGSVKSKTVLKDALGQVQTLYPGQDFKTRDAKVTTVFDGELFIPILLPDKEFGDYGTSTEVLWVVGANTNLVPTPTSSVTQSEPTTTVPIATSVNGAGPNTQCSVGEEDRGATILVPACYNQWYTLAPGAKRLVPSIDTTKPVVWQGKKAELIRGFGTRDLASLKPSVATGLLLVKINDGMSQVLSAPMDIQTTGGKVSIAVNGTPGKFSEYNGLYRVQVTR